MFNINESLLEMHYHRAFVEYFTQLFGARYLRLLKPSTNRETWVGFDQGWVRTSVSNKQLFTDLKTAIQNNHTQELIFTIMYFMRKAGAK